MRKLATGLLIATAALALSGCKKTADEAPVTAETAAAESTYTAMESAAAPEASAAAASEASDPNGNPIKP